jgi:hypothetical protein
MTMDGEKVSIEELKEMLEKIRALKAWLTAFFLSFFKNQKHSF